MAFGDLFGFGQAQPPGASPAWASVDGMGYQNGAPGVGTTLDGDTLAGGAGGGMSPQQRLMLAQMLMGAIGGRRATPQLQPLPMSRGFIGG